MKKINQTSSLRVALYIRVSTEEQVERYGIPLQTEALKALVKSRPKLEGGIDSMVLAGDQYIYIDKGVSGTDDLNTRPAFIKLKEDILLDPPSNKPFDVVAVYKIDRFARRLKILLEVIDFFEENEIEFMSANENIDTSTPFGRAILSIIGVIAELERETILDRTQSGRAQAFEAGVAMGANVPYGYIKDELKKYKIFDVEAEVVRQIFTMFVEEKRSTDKIARYLTENNILSPQASAVYHQKRKGKVIKKNPINFWRPEGVRKILNDEIYIGKIYSNKTKGNKAIPKSDWKLSPSPAPSIVDEAIFSKAQRFLSNSSYQLTEAKDGHIYLLSGLLRCDCCYDPASDKQGRMSWNGERKEIGKGSRKFTYQYKCGRKNTSKNVRICNCLPLPAESIEQYLIRFTRKLLESPVAVFKHQQRLQSKKSVVLLARKRERELSDMINAMDFRRARLQEQHEMGLISTDQLKNLNTQLNKDEWRLRQDLFNTRKEIAQDSVTEEYQKALDLFSIKYKATLDDVYKDPQALYTLFHELIEEVVVYGRPLEESDVVAGRKKPNQQIPNKLHIKLKLPQDILQELMGTSSGSKSISGAR